MLPVVLTSLLGCFAVYAPKVFKKVEGELNKLFLRHHTASRGRKVLRRILPGIYPSTTINLGPRVITSDHFDSANLAWGWIAITSLGDFDPTKGGHLILRTLGIMIEFPPGCTILFPSAVIQHSNTSTQPGETRMSITQYVSGFLMQYIAYGFTLKNRAAKSKPKLFKEMEGKKEAAWEEALGLFSKYDGLAADHQQAYGTK